MWQWSTTNWHFQKWLNNTFGNNTIECKKLATIVSGRKNVARSFFRWKQLSTSAEMQQQREFLAFYGVITKSVIQSFLKMPVCGASLSDDSHNSLWFRSNQIFRSLLFYQQHWHPVSSLLDYSQIVNHFLNIILCVFSVSYSFSRNASLWSTEKNAIWRQIKK